MLLCEVQAMSTPQPAIKVEASTEEDEWAQCAFKELGGDEMVALTRRGRTEEEEEEERADGEEEEEEEEEEEAEGRDEDKGKSGRERQKSRGQRPQRVRMAILSSVWLPRTETAKLRGRHPRSGRYLWASHRRRHRLSSPCVVKLCVEIGWRSCTRTARSLSGRMPLASDASAVRRTRAPFGRSMTIPSLLARDRRQGKWSILTSMTATRSTCAYI